MPVEENPDGVLWRLAEAMAAVDRAAHVMATHDSLKPTPPHAAETMDAIRAHRDALFFWQRDHEHYTLNLREAEAQRNALVREAVAIIGVGVWYRIANTDQALRCTARPDGGLRVEARSWIDVRHEQLSLTPDTVAQPA